MTFDLIRLRFRLRAREALHFPPYKAGNTLRGALGMLLPTAVFAPKSGGAGPSGLADSPRPFLVRASHLDGRTIARDAEFYFAVHVFDARGGLCEVFVDACSRWGKVCLLSAGTDHVSIDLDGSGVCASRVRVEFVTPTELKAGPEPVTQPEFGILFARLRDRISTLRALYGAGPLDIDFSAMGERAACVQLTRCELAWHEAARRSSRTGQTHPIGGFTGVAEYDGDLGEFLPYLRVGARTGVGRHTVWGKGEICFQLCS